MHPLFKLMIYNNHWLWAHVLLGGLAAKIFLKFFQNKPWKSQATFSCVFFLAVAYEVFEFFFLDWVGILDSVGDVLGAVLMALIVIW